MAIKSDTCRIGFGDISAQQILDKCEHHPLLRIRDEFSFEIFRGKLESLYSDTGRPGYDPVKMLKLLVLGKLQALSDVRLEFEILANLLYRDFCGFKLDDDTPDHSTISRFRKKLLPVWDELWAQFLDWLEDSGYVNDALVIVDSTAFESRGKYRADKGSRGDDGKIDYSGQSDPDARHGKKSKDKAFYGYKGHTGIDGNSDFIVAVDVTPGNIFDGAMLPSLISKVPYLPAAVTGDKAYNSAANRLFLWSQGVEDKTIPRHPKRGRKPKTYKQRRRIERVFSVIKEKFGFKRSRFFGLSGVALEFGLSALAFNLVNTLSIRGSPI
jgi:IS5 family transposase